MALINTLLVRFRVYAPDGAAIGMLAHPLSWEAGMPLNDMSSLTLTYPDGSEAADLLKAPCEVALELRNPNTGVWTEHPGCRFLNLRRSSDLMARPRILSFTMPSYGWMLKKIRWMDQDNPRLNKDRQIVYSPAASAAMPLLQMIDYAHNRRNCPGLTYDFSVGVDSGGLLWGLGFIGKFDYGQDAWSMIDVFAKQGFFDWRMNKRNLQMYRADTAMRRMLDTDTGVHVHSMATTEEPVERTWEDLAGHLVALGDSTSSWLLEAPDTIDYPWGKWDETVSASGVSDDQTLATITDRMLATKYKSRTQYTKKFLWTEGAPVPLFDYLPGDFIRATSDAPGAQKASMRVYQITLSGTDPYGVAVGLTLNDRFTDRALGVERWMSRVSGSGGPVNGGGTGAGPGKPSPPPLDNTPPKTPVLNSVTNAPYYSSLGEPVSMADVAFTVVTQDINGRSIDMNRYNIQARRSDLNDQQAFTVQVRQPDSPSTGQVIHAQVPLLDSGWTYYFSVQAIRVSGYPSQWSNVVSQAMAYPAEALEVPSLPQLSSKLGTVKAEWNGKDAGGNGYPPQFREIQVEVSKSTADGAIWYHAGDIYSAGSSVIMSGKGGTPTWNIGETVYVRFKAMNSAAVISGVSGVSQIVVTGVTGPDIEANSVTANHVVAGSLTAEQIQAHSLSVDRLSVGNPSNLMIDPTFSSDALNTARLAMAANSSAAALVWTVNKTTGSVKATGGAPTSVFGRFGLVNNTLLNVPLQTFPGAPLSSPERVWPVTRPGGTDGTTGNLKARFTVTATGIPANMGAATINVSILTRMYQSSGASLGSTGTVISDFTITANGTYTVQSVTGLSVPSGVVGLLPYLFVKSENGVPVTVALEFSQIEAWQEGSVFIGNGMIRTPLLASNAVTTDKLEANSITAKHSIRSAYYEMQSQSSTSIVKITENANYNGQAGLLWDGLTNYGPRIFQVDAAGTGGWDPSGFVVTGPEQTVNSSGRIDMQLSYGVTNSKLARAYGSEQISVQGLWWDTNTARFRIGGMFNTTHYTNDMFRFDRMAFQNGTYAYGNVTTRRYYPILTPNAGSTPVTSSVFNFPSGTEAGFRYVSSTGVAEVFFLCSCATP